MGFAFRRKRFPIGTAADDLAGYGVSHKCLMITAVDGVHFDRLRTGMFVRHIADFLHAGDQETERQESTGRKQENRCRMEPVAEDRNAAGTVGRRKEHAGTEKFTYRRNADESQRKADPRCNPVKERRKRTVLGSKGFRTGKDDAVNDDQRDEQTECRVDRREIRLDDQLNCGNKAGDDNDILSDTHFSGDDLTQERDKQIRERKHHDDRSPHAECIHDGGCGCKRRTHAEKLDKNRIIGQNPFLEQCRY